MKKNMNARHASAVLLNGQGVLLLGESGSGKSTTALYLIEAYDGMLIGDDRIHLTGVDKELMAHPHDELRGLIEMRGLGLLRLPYCERAKIALAVDLTKPDPAPRLAPDAHFAHQGAAVPLLQLDGRDPHTAMKIKWALAALQDGFRDTAIYPLHDG